MTREEILEIVDVMKTLEFTRGQIDYLIANRTSLEELRIEWLKILGENLKRASQILATVLSDNDTRGVVSPRFVDLLNHLSLNASFPENLIQLP